MKKPLIAAATVLLNFALAPSLSHAQATGPGPTITCASDSSIFNTGFNGAGGKLSPPAQDAFWEAAAGDASGPGSVTTWTQANVVGNIAPGSWVNSPFGNAEWIARGNGLGDGGGAIVYYRYQFNIDPSVDLATFSLNFDFYIDDYIQQIIVNSSEYKNYVSASSPNGQGGFASGAQLSETLSYGPTAPWVHGANSIVLKSWNNVAPTGLLAQTTTSTTCQPKLSIGKTTSASSPLKPKANVTYTVVATNTGLVAADGAVVADPMPPGISSGAWTCAASNGAVCPAASGVLPLSETIANFPSQGAVTYTIESQVAETPPLTITNTASLTLNTAICTPADCTASVSNAVTLEPIAVTPAPVPALNRWGWVLGIILLSVLGMSRLRKTGK
ncbi:hypothetical protein [Comamonas odontotermitis]|uniref:hypothetical protein n=1 Tax=Comamonas odontotermitis TaxID=379895 RepID=UPI0037530211